MEKVFLIIAVIGFVSGCISLAIEHSLVTWLMALLNVLLMIFWATQLKKKSYSWMCAYETQAVPEGFVLMPKEPTDEIIEAMNEFDYRNDYSDMDGAYRTIVETLEKAQEQK